VYVQGHWPRPAARADADASTRRANRLLASVDGLSDRLAEWPKTSDHEHGHMTFSPEEVERLTHTRDATAADFFNEGLPLVQLREEGVRLPPEEDSGSGIRDSARD
jgi:hypothetical protein